MRVLNKLSNEYAERIPEELYSKMPKAVLAAIAVSFAVRLYGSDDQAAFDVVPDELLAEWAILYQNGIVPQTPIKQ